MCVVQNVSMRARLQNAASAHTPISQQVHCEGVTKGQVCGRPTLVVVVAAKNDVDDNDVFFLDDGDQEYIQIDR